MSLFHSPIVRRWIDILLLSACSLILGLMLQRPLTSVLQMWVSYSSTWGMPVNYAVTLLIVTAVTVALIRLGAFGARFRIVTMLRCPPSWFAAVIVIVLIGVSVIQGEGRNTQSFAKELFHTESIVMILLPVGVLLGFYYNRLEELHSSPMSSKKVSSESSRQVRHIFENDEDLLSWIMEERPILHPNQDIFGHAIPARRIADFLTDEALSSIGIVGPYGCGKSSFVNLIEYYLAPYLPSRSPNRRNTKYDGNIVLCRIDGWGRASGTVAQKILSLAIGEVKKYVDCSSVITLPEKYVKAIAGGRSVGGELFSALFQGAHDPVSQLCRLDNILAAANLRLIIVLEDLDRNVGDAIIGEEMPALLDRLRILNNVSFVLAIGTGQQFSHILIRVCDHVEAIA